MATSFRWSYKPKLDLKLFFCDKRKTFACCRKKFMRIIFSFGLMRINLSKNLFAMDLFAQNIREFRQMRSYSQEYMALELGIHTSNYNRLETGIQHANISRVAEIARILCVEPFELFIDKTNRKRLAEAQLNENRLQQLELELLTLRKLLLTKSDSNQAIYTLSTSTTASNLQGFVS